MTAPLQIQPDAMDGRFARFELIGWWDQQRLARARVVLIGAGALGNEILKNLALLGVGNVLVADLDTVANSNLSRSVLFRAEDCGRRKVEVVAQRAVEIYPELRVRPFHGNIVYDLGLGVYRWADVILAGMDNREARVAINQADGDPPERYQLQYQIRSLRQKDDQLVEATTHLVEIALPRNYPRTPPQCRMLTPIFHPNIAPHAICIGDHWSAGEPLASIIARIGELIAYQSYNTKSPLNGEAARWTSEHEDELPLDPVNMLVEDTGTGPAPSAPPAPAIPPPPPPPPVAPPVVEAPVVVLCPQCSAQLRVAARYRGKQVQCPRCKTVMRVPGDAS